MAVGGVTSRTVTVAVQVAVLPLPSLAVNVTVFAPKFAQVKLVADRPKLGVPQLSVEPLLICDAVILALPPLKFTVMFWQLAVGGVTSRTVTVAVQVAVLPLPSLAVNVTVFAPKLAHVKLVVERPKLGVPQLSVEPLLVCDAVILALPPLKLTVMFWQSAVGGVTSRTVTVAVQVAVLPLPSFTVNVTVFAPRFEQVKLLGDTDCAVAVPQLSVEPLLTCDAVTFAVPPLKFTVIFWQSAVGGVTSLTVTVALHEACWLLLPVIVKVTVAGPMFEQFSTVGDTLRLAMPPKAVEPPSTSAAVIVTVPFVPRLRVMFWHTALGNWLFSTVTTAVQVEVLPFTSGTVKVTVFWPKLAKVKAFMLTVRVPRPQLSEEPLFTCAAVKEALPLPSNCSTTSRQRAVGAVLSRMVTVPVQVEVLPLPSLTVKITVLGPTFEQVKLLWETDCGVGVPQLSVEPLLICEALTVALPPLKFTVMF